MQCSLSSITGCGRDGIGMSIMIPSKTWLSFFRLYFLQAFRVYKFSKEEKDELAIQNLRRTDAVGLKIMIAAAIIIAFACAVKCIDGTMAGYALVGMIFVLAVIRFIIFSVMDSKGV